MSKPLERGGAPTPRVSVVIPCFNLGAYLDETVQSVLGQTYQDFEIVIVDDGSDDAATTHMLASYRRPRTRIIRAGHRGLAATRNAGLEVARGEYLSFLDADDVYEPMFLARTVDLLESNPSTAFASCWLRAFGERTFEWTPERCDFPWLLAEHTVCTAALTRRAALMDVGGYDTEMPVAGYEDWDLAISLVETGHVGAIIPEFLFRYRQRHGAMFSICTEPRNHARLFEYIVDKHREAYAQDVPGVVGVIEQRLAGLEQMLPGEAPPRPASDVGSDWKTRLLAFENHRRAVEELVASQGAEGGGQSDGQPIEWGMLRRLEPVSRVWGLDRGRPVDRYYIERFLQASRAAIRGDVLEVKDAGYTQRFGDDVHSSHIVDIAAHNLDVTLVADLSVFGSLPESRFDCFLITQTIHLIYEAEEVVRNAFRALRPHGTVLATLPCVSRIDYESGVESDFWRFTAASARRLFEGIFGTGNVEVESFGNVLACTAFLQGVAAEELAPAELDETDPAFPLLVAVKAVKPGARSAVASIEGRHERATCRGISGWAWNRAAPQRPVAVEVWDGERRLGAAFADRFRPDLAEAGIRDGLAAFRFAPNVDLHADPPRKIRVTVAGAGQPIRNSPLAIECVCGRGARAATRPPFDAAADPWIDVHDVAVEPDRHALVGGHIDSPRVGSRAAFPWLDVRGWALGREAPVSEVELLRGGEPFARVPADSPRPDVLAAFPGAPGSETAGFRARLSLLGLCDDVELELKAVLADGSRASLATLALRLGSREARDMEPLTAVIMPVRLHADAWNAVLGQHYLVERVLVVCAEPLARPGLRAVPSLHAAAGLMGDGLVWLHDGSSPLPPTFLAAATRRLAADPEASFVTDGRSPEASDSAVAAILSGAALGSSVVFRSEAVRSAGGFSEGATSAALAQWDACIRLVVGGQRGTWLGNEASAKLGLARQVGHEDIRRLYRMHSELYADHLADVLLEREATIGETLVRNHVDEREIESRLKPLMWAHRRERNRLGSRIRKHRPATGGPDVEAFDWGDFKRLEPLGPLLGEERGLSIDTYYVERFLEAHTADVRGAVLAAHDDVYARRYGGARVQRCDVFQPDRLDAKSGYDCILLPQLLHRTVQPSTTLRWCGHLLRPGGVLLATFPAARRVDPEAGIDGDYWRFTVEGVHRLVAEAFDGSVIEVRARGNRAATVALFAGLAAEDLNPTDLDRDEPESPVVVTARVATSTPS